ncbi:MAG: transposase [Spirochaetaceae bacterium]|nr:transposase [Spirochaetaceae bacterium]
MARRPSGIDLAKRTMEVRVLEGGKTGRHGLTPYIMSIPGAGIEAAGVLLGDGSRFDRAGQAANYAGFTPQVDCSGKTERYGGIAGYQFCHPIRRVVLERVWAMVRSRKGPLFMKYEELPGRMSKKKSVVAAAARKMAGLAWLLMKRLVWRRYWNGLC